MSVLLAVLFATALVLSSCSGATPDDDSVESASSIQAEIVALDEFPAELGRGFPSIIVEAADEGSPAAAGEPAPGFRLQLEDGRSVALADLRGRPVMLNFWATWCGPCRAEMPDIVAASEQDDELVVIAVNVQEDRSTARPFAQEFAMSMPVGMDEAGELRNSYGLRGMPTSVFIDREGTVASIWTGLLTQDRLDELLDEIR